MGNGHLNQQIRDWIIQAGGPDEIRRLLLLFYQRMSQDTMIGYFFTGKDLNHTAHRQADFILAAGGFLSHYTGKSPATAHAELPPIWSGHFDRRLMILRELLTEQKLPAATIDAWVGFEESFRKIVVS